MDVVLQHLVMQVYACGLACAAYEAYQLTALHLLSLAHSSLLEVGVTGLVAETVVDGDHIAIAPVVALNVGHHAVAGGIGLGTQGGREVDAAVELLDLIDRVGTIAEIRGDVGDLVLFQGEDGGDMGQHGRLVARHHKQRIVGDRLVIELTGDDIHLAG